MKYSIGQFSKDPAGKSALRIISGPLQISDEAVDNIVLELRERGRHTGSTVYAELQDDAQSILLVITVPTGSDEVIVQAAVTAMEEVMSPRMGVIVPIAEDGETWFGVIDEVREGKKIDLGFTGGGWRSPLRSNL